MFRMLRRCLLGLAVALPLLLAAPNVSQAQWYNAYGYPGGYGYYGAPYYSYPAPYYRPAPYYYNLRPYYARRYVAPYNWGYNPYFYFFRL